MFRANNPPYSDCLECYKTHAATHTEAEKLEVAAATSATLQAQNSDPSIRTPDISTSTNIPDSASSDPLLSLAESSEFQQLLKDQPELREKLRTIHTAVRDAESAPGRKYSTRDRGSGRGRGRGRGQGRRTPWQRPDDLERGMRALQDIKLSEGQDGGSLKRFMELVNERNTVSQANAAVDAR